MIFQVGRIHLWMIVLIQWIKSGCCDMLLEIQFVDFINLKLLDQTCNVAFPSAKFLNEQSYFFQSTVKEILYVWRLVMVQDSNDETKALIIRNAFYMSGNQMSILKRVFYKVKANNDTNQELVLTMFSHLRQLLPLSVRRSLLVLDGSKEALLLTNIHDEKSAIDITKLSTCEYEVCEYLMKFKSSHFFFETVFHRIVRFIHLHSDHLRTVDVNSTDGSLVNTAILFTQKVRFLLPSSMRTPFVYQQINDKRRHFLKSYNLLAIENRTGKLIFFSVHRTHVQPESNFGLRLPNFIVESSLLVTLFGCQATVCFNLHVYEAIYGKLSHEDFPERLYMFQDNIFWRSPLASHGSHPMFVRPSAEFVKNLPDLYFGFRNLLLFETLDIQVAMYLFDTRFLLMDCRLPRQKQYQHPKTTYALPPMLDFADVVFNIGPYVYSLKDEVIQTMRVKVSLESVIFLGKLDIQKRLDNVLLPLSSAFVMFGDLIFLSNAAFGSVKVADMVNERIVALEVSEPKSFGAWFYGCEPYFGNILARSTYRTDRFASGFHWQNINAGRPALFEDKIFEYIIWYGFFMYLLIDIIIYMLKRKYVRKRS